MSKKEKHTHKLKRHKYTNGTTIFFCILGCSFKIEAALAVGHKTICHECGSEFTLNEKTIRMLRPHCSSCGRTRIKGPDGKFRVIPKSYLTINVSDEIANDTVTELKDRLAAVVPMIDEDL